MQKHLRTAIAVIGKGIVFIGLIALVGACDNPVEADEEEEHDHAEVEGLVLLVGGDEVVRVQEAEVTGELHLEAGGPAVTVVVEFLDHDGDHIHVEDLDDEFSLGWELESEAVVTINQTDTWSFSLTPVAEGETHISVQLMHGSHPDFTTPDVHVHVE